MSKIYFAEYIPVKGEVKEGDKFRVPDSDTIYTKSILGTHDRSHVEQKVQLSLCSRDIQVGDKVQPNLLHIKPTEILTFGDDGEGNKTAECENGDWYRLVECYKVIGEISPDAIWVKRHMEFDEDELCLFAKAGFNSGSQNHALPFVPNKSDEFYTGIKCTTCKQFH